MAPLTSSVSCDGITYSVTEIGQNAFSGRSELTEVTIPNSVTSIGGGAFYGCTGLTSMTIPNSVTKIGESAFNGCTGLTEVNISDLSAWCKIDFDNDANPLSYAQKLKLNGTEITNLVIPDDITKITGYSFCGYTNLASVTIPNSVTEIGYGAFSGCTGLTEVTIPNSVTSIGNYAFSGCTGLTEVTIGNSVTWIPWSAFSGCTGLTEVTIPNSVTTIYDEAFSGCTGLTSVTIPNSVTEIYNEAFSGCTGLKDVNISDLSAWCKIDFYDDTANPLYYTQKLTLNGSEFTNLIIIPDDVTVIKQYAFCGCSGFTSVTFGNSVESIAKDAFNGCNSITIINSYNTTAPTLNSEAFESTIKQNAILNVPSSALASYQSAEVWKDFINIRTFATNGTYDFEVDGIYYRIVSLTDLTAMVVSKDGSYNSYSGDVVIPETVTYRNRDFKVIEIDALAFSYSTELTSLSIPQTITTIGQLALNECSSLKTLTVADGETGLIENANFTYLPLETLYMGRNLTCSFKDTHTLQSLTIGNSVTSIGESAFSGCTGLTEVTIPNSVTGIGSSAFNGCTRLTEVTIPNSVTGIGASAFNGCTGLTSVTIGNSVTSIGESAFDGCTGLTEVNISDLSAWCKIDFLGNTANPLYYAHKLTLNGTEITNLIIPDDITEIKQYTFYCPFTSITIPNSVTKIGAVAINSFRGKLIILKGTNKINIYNNSFGSALVSLYLGRDIIFNIDVEDFYYEVTSPFSNFTNLSSVTLGSGMSYLQSDAFTGCTALKELTIEGGDTDITIDATFSDSPIEKLHIGRNGTYAFNNRVDLKEVSIGDNVTAIPANAFNGCSNISTLKFGNKVETIGANAFAGCATLMNVYSTNLTPPTGAAFDNNTYLQGTLYVVKGSKDAYATTDGWKEFWEINDNLPFEVNGNWYNIDTDGNVVLVANPSGDAYVDDIVIPATVSYEGKEYLVTSIDADAFANAINVTSITIEDSEQSLTINAPTEISTMSNEASGTFSACLLTSVYVGRNLNYQDAPFASISSIKEVTIGDKVTTMGGAMFAGCENITTVYVEGSTPASDAEFESKVYDNATLIVPAGALAAYTTADGWKEFFTIKDVNGNSGIDNIITDNEATSTPIISVENSTIVVEGADEATISVFNINGTLIYSGINCPVTVANRGVYIVVVNGKATKIVI